MMTPRRPIKANPRSLEIEYAIRDVILPAMELEKKGHRILKLNIGDPNKYDFDTPEFIKDGVREALGSGHNGYCPSRGYPELLDAIIAALRVATADRPGTPAAPAAAAGARSPVCCA